MTPPVFELYAIRYATNPARTRGHNYILADRPDAVEPMDYFSWLAIGPGGPVVIDTGLLQAKALARGYTMPHTPMDGLRALGVDPAAVERVVVTHLHYDHIGNTEAFPKARFELQAAEMAHATGPLMAQPFLRLAYEPEEIARFVFYLHAGRLHLHGPEHQVLPGLTVHWVGGHTAGQEVVRVHTRRGWMVLASDALHYYEEYERGLPFTVATDVAAMLLAHGRIRALADSDAHIVPSHDPAVADRFPPARADLAGFVYRLD